MPGARPVIEDPGQRLRGTHSTTWHVRPGCSTSDAGRSPPACRSGPGASAKQDDSVLLLECHRRGILTIVVLAILRAVDTPPARAHIDGLRAVTFWIDEHQPLVELAAIDALRPGLRLRRRLRLA